MNAGVFFALLSSLVFSLMNALVKAVSDTIPPAETAFFRSAIGTVIIVLMMRRSRVAFSTKGIPLLALRGVLGALYLLAYFYTISKIPLTDATILAHLSPVFVILLSSLVLKERLPAQTSVVFLAALLGAVLLVKPFHYSAYSFYALAGIASALLAAAAGISIRYLSRKHHTYEIVFYFLATGTLVSVPLMWGQYVPPTLSDWIYLIAIGIVSLFGQLFLTKAFTHENAAIVEMTRYIGIVYNAWWGFFFWAEVPDAYTVIGGVIIVASCIWLSRRKSETPLRSAA